MEETHVLNMVKRELKKNHISPAELARQLNSNPSSIHGMLNRPTIQVQKLIKLSEILGYNFFREIAEQLPYEYPKAEAEETVEKQLKERIKELEIEANTLRRTIKEIING